MSMATVDTEIPYHFAQGTPDTVVFRSEEFTHDGFNGRILLIEFEMQPLSMVVDVGLQYNQRNDLRGQS